MLETKSKMVRMCAAYSTAAANLRHMGETIKELMRHPDTSTTQLVHAHITYSQIFTSFHTTRAILRAKYPDPHKVVQYPWNKEIK
jgi:hypothetical protein